MIGIKELSVNKVVFVQRKPRVLPSSGTGSVYTTASETRLINVHGPKDNSLSSSPGVVSTGKTQSCLVNNNIDAV